MNKILHIIYSLDLGGGPMHIGMLVKDIPAAHYVLGKGGNMQGYFEDLLGNDHVFAVDKVSSYLATIRKAIREINPDVIHAHGKGAALLVRCAGIKGLGSKLIYTIHGFHANNTSGVRKLIYRLAEINLYSFVRYFIHVSEVERREFSDFIGKKAVPDKHIYIPNYIDVKKPRYLEKEALSLFPANVKPYFCNRNEYIKLLFVGRFSAEKGLDIFLESLKHLSLQPKLEIFIIGYGPEEEYYESIAASGPYQHKIHFLGKIDNASSLMEHFDGLVIPSRKEGLPYTLLEALANKVPVITTPEASFKSVLQDHYRYTATNFSAVSLAQILEVFLADYQTAPETINVIVEKNYDQILKYFSKDVIINKLITLYENLHIY